MLEQEGLVQYEVSNFAKVPNETMPNNTCAHNIRYWRMENWLGAGPAASGTLIDETTGTGRRRTYQADIATYLAAPAPRIMSACVEELKQTDLIRESLLMGFRYRKGPDPDSFKRRFGCGIEDCIPQTVTRWRDRSFFDNDRPSRLAHSTDGLLFLNSFLRDAFAELDSRESLIKAG
jgi:oxygen-independent coproporphyrinogen-3 oxidase